MIGLSSVRQKGDEAESTVTHCVLMRENENIKVSVQTKIHVFHIKSNPRLPL